MDKNLEKNIPLVSVLMCVYNGDKYVEEAIESVLSQTYTNFEFIIINDGSTDNTALKLSLFDDVRINHVSNETNKGLIASLNIGLLIAQGDYIARMDADDICYRERLAKQVDFFRLNPSVGVCGSNMSIIGADNKYEFSSSHDAIKVAMLDNNPMAHSSVMFNNKLFKKYNLQYDSLYKGAEDYELWSRAITTLTFANIPQALLQYRVHSEQVTQNNKNIVSTTTQKVKLNMIRQFEIYPTERQQVIHLFLFDYQYKEQRGLAILQETDEWLYQLYMANKKLSIIKPALFFAMWRTKTFVTAIAKYDLAIWKILKKSYCFQYANVPLALKAKLYIKCLIKRRVGNN